MAWQQLRIEATFLRHALCNPIPFVHNKLLKHYRVTSPYNPTHDISSTSIGLRSGDLDGQGKALTLRASKVQSRVCGMRSRTILPKIHTPVISKKFGIVWTNTWACKQLPCYTHKKLKEENKIIHIEEARM